MSLDANPAPVVLVVGLNHIHASFRSSFEPWAQFRHEGQIKRPDQIDPGIRCIAVNSRLSEKDRIRFENFATARQIPLEPIDSADLLENAIGRYNPNRENGDTVVEGAPEVSVPELPVEPIVSVELAESTDQEVQLHEPLTQPIVEGASQLQAPIPTDVELLAAVRRLPLKANSIGSFLRDNVLTTVGYSAEIDRLMPAILVEHPNTNKHSVGVMMSQLLARARKSLAEELVITPEEVTAEVHSPAPEDTGEVERLRTRLAELTQQLGDQAKLREQLDDAREAASTANRQRLEVETENQRLRGALDRQVTRMATIAEELNVIRGKLRQGDV